MRRFFSIFALPPPAPPRLKAAGNRSTEAVRRQLILDKRRETRRRERREAERREGFEAAGRLVDVEVMFFFVVSASVGTWPA